MRRTVVIALVSALCVGSALAGPAYTPPKVSVAKTLEAPEDLRAAATELLQAVGAKDIDGVGRRLAPKLTLVTGAIDLASPRVKSQEGPWKDVAAQVVGLGSRTGGDGDVPQGADLGKFLTGLELAFIAQSLTDGQPWGIDPMVKGATCTYGVGSYDPAAVGRTAKKLGIEASSFAAVRQEIEVADAVDGKPVGGWCPGCSMASTTPSTCRSAGPPCICRVVAPALSPPRATISTGPMRRGCALPSRNRASGW